jgi:MFS family permease
LGAAQFAFSLFILPLEEAFGWSRTEVNGALICGVVSGLLSPYIGRMMDRVGAKWTMVGSIALVATAFLLRAAMTELWQFYLFSVLMFAGMPGATMMPAGRLVNLWFPRIRGRMMGFVTAGNNFGGMVAIPIVAALITVVGWRGAFVAMAIGLLGVPYWSPSSYGMGTATSKENSTSGGPPAQRMHSNRRCQPPVHRRCAVWIHRWRSSRGRTP